MMTREIVLAVIVFASYTIHAITGFAGTLLSMPAAIQLVGLEDARVSLNIAGTVGCVLLLFQCWKKIPWKECLRILAVMSIGIAIGMIFLRRFPLRGLLYAYGALIVAIAVLRLSGRNYVIPEKLSPLLLVASGAMQGLFLSGGAMLVVYASDRVKDKSEFRAAMTPVWIILNSMIFFEQFVSNSLTPRNLTLAGICIPPILLGILAGNALHGRVSEKAFWRFASVLLLISGLVVFG